MSNGEDFVYVFGYGSLMWRPGFAYLRKFDGYIKDMKRVFWQGSMDHRGTPTAPGRVVTLVKTPPAQEHITWGVVFVIPALGSETILDGLDYREKGGYLRERIDVYVPGAPHAVAPKAYVYYGDETNRQYLGPAPARDIARQIYSSFGRSGPNIDYLLNVAKELERMCVVDDHIVELEHHVRMFKSAEANIDMSTVTLYIDGKSPQTQRCEIRECVRRKSISAGEAKGRIVVDDAAMSAISNMGMALLAAWIVHVEGVFSATELICISNSTGMVFARGCASYGSEEITRIRGMHASLIPAVLGIDRGEAVVSLDNLILV